MTFLQCHSDFEEHNQVLGRVNNNSKLIPEDLVVPKETFETKPEFQQQKGKAWSRVQPVQFEARYGESVKVLTHTKEYKINKTRGPYLGQVICGFGLGWS